MGVNEYIRIGNKIKKIRKSKRLTQREVANALGIPFSTYSNYENDNREPNFVTLEKIASALGVSMADLMGWDEDGAHIKQLAEEVKASEAMERDLVTTFIRLNHEGQKKLLAYAEDISSIRKYRADE